MKVGFANAAGPRRRVFKRRLGGRGINLRQGRENRDGGRIQFRRGNRNLNNTRN